MDFYTKSPEDRFRWIQDICRVARSYGIPNEVLVKNRYRILSTEWQAVPEIQLLEDLRFQAHLQSALAAIGIGD